MKVHLQVIANLLFGSAFRFTTSARPLRPDRVRVHATPQRPTEGHRLASCFEGWVGSGSSRIGLGQHFWALRRCLVGEDDGFEVKTEIKYSCK
jgi:hypothetical protein